jgi:hypothetical protein
LLDLRISVSETFDQEHDSLSPGLVPESFHRAQAYVSFFVTEGSFQHDENCLTSQVPNGAGQGGGHQRIRLDGEAGGQNWGGLEDLFLDELLDKLKASLWSGQAEFLGKGAKWGGYSRCLLLLQARKNIPALGRAADLKEGPSSGFSEGFWETTHLLSEP